MNLNEERRKDYPMILDKLEVIKTDIIEVKKEVRVINVILNGNGKKGFVARVEDAEDFIRIVRNIGQIAVNTIFVTCLLAILGYIFLRLGIPSW